MKPVNELTASDLHRNRVWEFASESEGILPNETYMRPVDDLPVHSLAGRLVAAQLTLASELRLLGLLGNIELGNPLQTEHFLAVTVFRPDGDRFHLARYHDSDYARHNPDALAAFLGIPLHSVFPMNYDITDVAMGHLDSLRRVIPAVPSTRLTQDELMRLALT